MRNLQGDSWESGMRFKPQRRMGRIGSVQKDLVYGTSPRDRNKKAFDLLPLVTRRVSKTSSSLALLGLSYLTRIRQKPFGVTSAAELVVSGFSFPDPIAILNSRILSHTSFQRSNTL